MQQKQSSALQGSPQEDHTLHPVDQGPSGELEQLCWRPVVVPSSVVLAVAQVLTLVAVLHLVVRTSLGVWQPQVANLGVQIEVAVEKLHQEVLALRWQEASLESCLELWGVANLEALPWAAQASSLEGHRMPVVVGFPSSAAAVWLAGGAVSSAVGEPALAVVGASQGELRLVVGVLRLVACLVAASQEASAYLAASSVEAAAFPVEAFACLAVSSVEAAACPAVGLACPAVGLAYPAVGLAYPAGGASGEAFQAVASSVGAASSAEPGQASEGASQEAGPAEEAA